MNKQEAIWFKINLHYQCILVGIQALTDANFSVMVVQHDLGREPRLDVMDAGDVDEVLVGFVGLPLLCCWIIRLDLGVVAFA